MVQTSAPGRHHLGQQRRGAVPMSLGDSPKSRRRGRMAARMLLASAGHPGVPDRLKGQAAVENVDVHGLTKYPRNGEATPLQLAAKPQPAVIR